MADTPMTHPSGDPALAKGWGSALATMGRSAIRGAAAVKVVAGAANKRNEVRGWKAGMVAGAAVARARGLAPSAEASDALVARGAALGARLGRKSTALAATGVAAGGFLATRRRRTREDGSIGTLAKAVAALPGEERQALAKAVRRGDTEPLEKFLALALRGAIAAAPYVARGAIAAARSPWGRRALTALGTLGTASDAAAAVGSLRRRRPRTRTPFPMAD